MKKYLLILISVLLVLLLLSGVWVYCVLNLSQDELYNSLKPYNDNFNRLPNLSKEYSSNGGCFVNNCHFGADNQVYCSEVDERPICTLEFTNGDNCGMYVQCSRVNEGCVHITNPEYEYCISCSAGCLEIKDMAEKESCVKKCEKDFP